MSLCWDPSGLPITLALDMGEAVWQPQPVSSLRGGRAGLPTCDGALAARALLGDALLVAVHAVEVVLHGREAPPANGLLAAGADEALGVPGLLLVGDASGSDGLGEDKDRPALAPQAGQLLG